MEVDFPVSREGFRQSDDEKSRDAIRALLESSDEDGHYGRSGPSRGGSSSAAGSDDDGFMAWPSGRSSRSDGSSYVKVEEEERRRRSLKEHELTSDDGSNINNHNGSGDMTVDFPTDRTPFYRRRRSSCSSYQSSGGMSGYNACGSRGSRGSREKSRASKSAGGGDDGSDNSLSNANTSGGVNSGLMSLQRRPSNSSPSHGRPPSLSSSLGSNASNGANNGGAGPGGLARRRSSRSAVKSIGHRASLDTINSEKSFRSGGSGGSLGRQNSGKSLRDSLGVGRQNSAGSGKSLRGSLRKQSSGNSLEQKLRRSIERKENQMSQNIHQADVPSRRKSKEGLARRPSLTQLHDENVMALPLLGWDVPDDSNSSSMHSEQRNSMRGSWGPAKIDPGLKSSASVASSLKASQYDQYEAVNMLCEEFVPRGSFRKNNQQGTQSPLGPMNTNGDQTAEDGNGDGNGGNRDLLMMMMEEEYDPRKPWRRAPAGAVVAVQDKNRRSGNSGSGAMRRASGFTTRSSFASDMSFGDVMLAEMQGSKLSNGTEAEIEKAMGLNDDGEEDDGDATRDDAEAESRSIAPDEATIGDMTAEAVVTSATDHSPYSDADTFGENAMRASVVSNDATSALSEDDGSELTELRQAQEALFSVPESVTTASQQDTESVASEIKEVCVDHSSATALSSSQRSGGSARSCSNVKDLSSLDIVQQQPQDHKSNLASSAWSQTSSQPLLPPVKENGGSDEEKDERTENNMLTSSALLRMSSADDMLDDLPVSSQGDDLIRKRPSGLGKLDDDSVSYSDIDVETGHQHGNGNQQAVPSIKMCMTVRDSVIEREFATEQLADIEFGETKDPMNGAEMTLRDLLEGTPDNENANDFFPAMNDDSMRSGQSNSANTKKSSSRRTMNEKTKGIRESVIKRTSKLDTRATKNLRRKNKRLWKFCVWNCRKITVCLILGLCLLAGIAALTWWGVAKVTGDKGGGGDDDGGAVVAQNADADGGLTPVMEEGEESQLPSRSPSSLASAVDFDAPVANVESPPELPPSSAVPSVAPTNVTHASPGVPAPEPGGMTSPSLVPHSSNNTDSDPQMPSSTVNVTDATNTSIYSYDATSTSSPSYSGSSIITQSSPSYHPSSGPGPSTNMIPSPTVTISNDTELHNSTSSIIQTPTVNSSFVSLDLSPSLSIDDSSNINQDTLTGNSVSISSSPVASPSLNSTTGGIPSSANLSDIPILSDTSNSSGLSSTNTTSSSLELPSAPTTMNQSLSIFPSGDGQVSDTPDPSIPDTLNTDLPLVDPIVLPAIANQSSSSAPINKTLVGVIPSGANASDMSIILTTSNSTGAPSTNTSSSFELPSANSSVLPTVIANQSSSIKYESLQLISGAKGSEYAGQSVSISPTGEHIAVGFKEADSPAVVKAGLVRVYRRNSDGLYTQLGQDSMFGTASGDEFGASVSISNDGLRVAVGARSASTSPELQKNGEARVHEYSEADDSWSQIGNTISGLVAKDRLGFAVSISGDGSRVAVGAPRGNGGTGASGVYEYNGLDWIPFGNAVVGGNAGDRAGFSVSLSNDGGTLAVGAFTSSTEDLDKCGSVSVYQLVGSSTDGSSSSSVNLVQTLVGATERAQFGYSAFLSGDGTRLAVGSNGFSTANSAKVGLCEVYELEAGHWNQIGALNGSEENEASGSHVSISYSGNVISCSKSTIVDGNLRGAVSVLQEGGAGWDVVDVIAPSFGDSTSFGASVSLSQDAKVVLAGAPSYNSSAGFFELFTRSG